MAPGSKRVQDRRSRIVEIVESRGSVSTSELSELLNVSEMTIRRDLEYLDRRMALTKTYGGATARHGTLTVTDFFLRLRVRQQEKRAIARKAAEFVENGESLFLDHGTTCLALARELKRFANLTVITHSVPIIWELLAAPINLICPGGALQHPNVCFVGPLAEETIAQLHADKAFMGTQGLTPETGMSDTDLFEVAVKRRMIESATQVILLADHTKLGRRGLHQTVPLDRIHVLITDSNARPEVLAPYREAGIEVVVTPVEEQPPSRNARGGEPSS